MRKKLLSKTYLRDVTEYTIKIDYSNDDYWYSVKKFIDTKPFILSNGLKVIDNGYYMLELLPKNENYSMRVYFDDKKEILEYYFDITLGNGVDEETKIPYYDDAFIDITITGTDVEVLDEDELDEALRNKVITFDEYVKVKDVANKLYNAIISNTNKYINLNLRTLI